jgi:hypothetical protein
MQPNPNQPPEDKPHAVGFKTDVERVIFFQNVAELMWRDGVIKRNTIPAFMGHAAFETANLYKFMESSDQLSKLQLSFFIASKKYST